MSVKIFKTTLLGVALLCGTFAASAWDYKADELSYSYARVKDLKPYGTSRPETYDLAIFLPDKALVGKTVEGVRIPFYSIENLSNFKVWMTKKLDLEDFTDNIADICSQDAVLTDGEYVEVRFDKPYTIDADGVYVGYSFTVDEAKDKSTTPVMGSGTDVRDGGFYIHTSYSQRKWTSKSMAVGMNLGMEVIVGGMDENSLGVTEVTFDKAAMGKEVTGTVTLSNHGTAPVKSFEYSIVCDGKTTTGTVDVPADAPIATKKAYNTEYSSSFTIPALSSKGEFPVSFTINKVNGVDNVDGSATMESNVSVSSRVAFKRPVYEEYTGTWCGNCTRGIASLDYMLENIEDFIGIAYHNNDPMEVFAQRNFPETTGGFPFGRFDRTKTTDVYYGSRTDGKFGDDAIWIDLHKNSIAPADVDVECEWTDEAQTAIKVTSTVNFIEPEETNFYRLAYCLLADEMEGKGTSWKQHNYYVGNTKFDGDPYMEPFVNGTGEMYCKFSNVIIASSDIKGIQGSLPESIDADKDYTHEFTFELAKANGTSGRNLVQDKTKLRVVALLLDPTRKIANAAKCFVPGYDGPALKAVGKGNPTVPRSDAGVSVPGIDNDSNVTVEAIYDLNGRQVENPASGIYIMKLSNGKTRKYVVR